MTKGVVIAFILVVAAGCASAEQPVVKFHDPATGATSRCGGAEAWIFGGVMGGLSYDRCIEVAKEQGLERVY